MKDWIITFNNGSTAQYFNMNLLDAMKMAIADWAPHKHPVAWHEVKMDVFSLPLD
tara:strand:- start:174 stop:338 length:165 start_codon:yes stop_codon:yes gene_type:complete